MKKQTKRVNITNKMQETLDFLLSPNHDDSFKYQMLGRMQLDCQCYIANGYCSHLWGINPEEHIIYMKALWKSFPKNKKPKWCFYRDILAYEKEMVK